MEGTSATHVATRMTWLRRLGWWLLTVVSLKLLGWLVGAICLGLGAGVFQGLYAERIYPGVTVHGVALGGLTQQEAEVALETALAGRVGGQVTLRDGERRWTVGWEELGIAFDAGATARLAYRLGREGTTGARLGAQLEALLVGCPSPVVIVLPGEEQAAALLERLAPQVYLPPADAQLVINPGGVLEVPARTGRELDVGATAARLLDLLQPDPTGLALDLVMWELPPRIPQAGQARTRAEALLAQPFTLLADDPVTRYRAEWTVGWETLLEWLVVERVEEGHDVRLQLTVDEAPVRAYLTALSEQVGFVASAQPSGEGRALDVEETLSRVQQAVEKGVSQVEVAVIHPPRIYVVQEGDSLGWIAASFGMPVWMVEAANPDLDPDGLIIGQEVLIPSQDLLTPLPVVREREIVVDLSDQHLYAYEEDALVYDFVCSTGISTSPTITGTFQVLTKELMAYASLWDLQMPHFLAVYPGGPDLMNGIHALPILSSGRRLWEGYLGWPVSYGCIVLGVEEAERLYAWAEVGVLVRIRE